MATASAISVSQREQLRFATRVAHARLDRQFAEGIGHLADYRVYLLGMQAFVAGLIEAADAHLDDATRTHLAMLDAALRVDIAGLGGQAMSACALTLADSDAVTGARYVLEGSALGARLLLRQAEAAGHPHRFLRAHAADPARWQAFVARLDALPDRATLAVHQGAQQAFAAADSAFGRARDGANARTDFAQQPQEGRA